MRQEIHTCCKGKDLFKSRESQESTLQVGAGSSKRLAREIFHSTGKGGSHKCAEPFFIGDYAGGCLYNPCDSPNDSLSWLLSPRVDFVCFNHGAYIMRVSPPQGISDNEQRRVSARPRASFCGAFPILHPRAVGGKIAKSEHVRFSSTS